jgi:hypothetical protein
VNPEPVRRDRDPTGEFCHRKTGVLGARPPDTTHSSPGIDSAEQDLRFRVWGMMVVATIAVASYGANHMGIEAGRYIFIDLGGTNEEYVKVVSADPENQRFDAIVTQNHSDGERLRPTIWPTPVLNEGDDLPFDVLGVTSPDPGSDLTVVIQT